VSKVLLSFLGRAKKRDGERGYQTANYLFDDGSTREDAFFGRALAEQLAPDRMVIFGTRGSMWDVMAETVGSEISEAWMDVAQAAGAGSVTQEQLDAMAPEVGRSLGRPCALRIIPEARTTEEQVALLAEIARHCESKDVAHIDLTHGYRTLPMLGLLAALFLSRARKVQIGGLYYGAFEMRDAQGRAPVQRLDGLLRIAQWVEALAGFDASGSFGAFAPPMQHDGVAAVTIAHLRRAAFHERTFNLVDATHDVRSLLQELPDPAPGIGALFRDQIAERLGWHKHRHLFERQRDLAWIYLQRRDWVRCAVFAYEAFLSKLVADDSDGRENSFDARDAARREFERRERGDQALREEYFTLKHIRNYLAHGSVASETEEESRWMAKKRADLLRLVSNEDRLHQKLRACIQELVGKP